MIIYICNANIAGGDPTFALFGLFPKPAGADSTKYTKY